MKRAAVSLPDELVLEILARLKDAPVLFRCATVCKQWRRLMANPAFLRCCWPEEACASIAGFFTREEQRDGQQLGRPCFVPAPRSAMGRGCRALSAFLKPAPSGGHISDRADPLVSRHGLLLVRLDRRGGDLDPDLTAVHLAVCNLYTGECHVLPPVKCGRVDRWSGYAILSSTDCTFKSEQPLPVPSRNSVPFKVVIIDMEYNLYTFSSGQASWGTPTFSGANTSNYIPVSHGAAVVCRGTAHWLFHNLAMSCLCTIDMDVQTGHVSLTTIPFMVHYTACHACLTLAIDGTISLIDIQREGLELKIRKIVDDTAELLCTRTIKLQEPRKMLTRGISNLYMLEEKYGMMVVTGSGGGKIYVADLETETVEELLEWPRHHASRAEVVPFQMDWFTFFLSPLGIRAGGDAYGGLQLARDRDI